MIFPSNRVRIVVATKPVDFRKGHDGLAALVKNELHKDPFTGTVFVFRSRKADRLKLIYWDGSGIVMAYKRLEEHSFTWPGIKDGLYLTRATAEARMLLQLEPETERGIATELRQQIRIASDGQSRTGRKRGVADTQEPTKTTKAIIIWLSPFSIKIWSVSRIRR